MTRPHDWPERLDAEMASAAATPAAWGRQDCFLWACRVVHRLGGPDLADGLRDTYASEAEAEAIIRSVAPDLAGFLRQRCQEAGMQEIPPAFAQRGDLVCVRLPRAQATGICAGAVAMVTAWPAGVLPVPMARAVAAWAV